MQVRERIQINLTKQIIDIETHENRNMRSTCIVVARTQDYVFKIKNNRLSRERHKHSSLSPKRA